MSKRIPKTPPKPKKRYHMRIDKRVQEISPQETITKAINFAHGEKYVNPRDENERGFNRGIDAAIAIIKEIETFEPFNNIF